MNEEPTQIVEGAKLNYVEVPDRYIFDATIALLTCNNAVRAYAPLHENIQNMLDHFDGRLPKDPEQLKANNLEWTSNVPYGKAFLQLQNETTNRLGVFIASLSFLQLYLKPHSLGEDRDELQFYYTNPIFQQEIQNALGACLVGYLLKDVDWMQFLLTTSFNTVSWGYSTCIAQQNSPYSFCPDIRDICFEPEAKIENVKTAVWFNEQSALDVYRIYLENCLQAENPLWDREALEDALFYAIQDLPTGDNNASILNTYKNWQTIYPEYLSGGRTLRHDLANGKNIIWAYIINEEFDGSVTLTIYEYFYQGFAGSNVPATTSSRNGLRLAFQENFKDEEFGDKFRLIRNSGISTSTLLQRMKGLAPFAYEAGVEYDYFRNNQNDAVTIHSALKFQPESELQDQAFKISFYGGMMLFPTAFPLMRVDNTAQVLSASVEMLRFMDEEHRRMTDVFSPQVAGKLTDRATNQQVLEISNEVAQAKQDSSAIFLFDLEKELLAVLKRIKSNPKGKQFKKNREIRESLSKQLQVEILDKYVPDLDIDALDFLDQVIEDIYRIDLSYMTNNVPRLQKLIEISPNQTSQNYYRRRLAAALSVPYVEQQTYFSITAEKDAFSGQVSLAALENNALWDTRELPVQPIQDHVTHLQSHFFRANEVVQSLQRGVDPVEVFKWVSNCLEHCRFHLEELAYDQLNIRLYENFVDFFKGLEKQQKAIEKIAQRAAQAIQQQAAAQQQGGGQSPEEAELRAEIEMDRRRLEADIEIRQEASKSRQAQLRDNQQFKQSLQRENADFSTELKSQQAAQKQLNDEINARRKSQQSASK